MTVAKAEQLDDKAGIYRAKFGLTFNQWKHLQKLGYTTDQIARYFYAWQRIVRRAIDREYENADYRLGDQAFLSATQVSRATGLGQFHVCNLNHRGKLPGSKAGRYIAYDREDVLAIVNRDWSDEEPKRSPLAAAFISWLEMK